VENIGAVSDRADLVQFCNAIAVFVDPHIGLDVVNLRCGLVILSCDAEKRLICGVSDDDFVVHLKTASSGVLLDDCLIVTHLNQLRNGRQLASGNIDRVCNAGGFVVDQELLRRNALDHIAGRLFGPLDAHCDALLASHHVHFFGVFINGHVRVLGNEACLCLGDARIGIILHRFIGADIPCQNACFQDQSILDGIMQDAETGVFLHEDVVDQVCCLFSALHILGRLRNELQKLVAAGENAQKRWDHGQNGVAHLRHDHLRSALLLIAKEIAQVKRHCAFTLWRNIAVNVGCGVLNGLCNPIAELLIRHRHFIWCQKPSLTVVSRVLNAIRADRDQIGIVSAE